MNLTTTSAALMCLGPDRGGALDVRQLVRWKPAPNEVEVAVEAASVNPIDVRRREGYGRRLLALLGAAKFPLVLGNDFAGTVTAVGSRASPFKIGDRAYGVKPPSRRGTQACHVLVKAAHARLAPAGRDIQDLAALPYCFVTMWLAIRAAGLSRQNAVGRRVLVHGAAGGLGTLALQMLSNWGAEITAVAWSSAFAACRQAGADEVLDAATKPFSALGHSFDATLNFATWNDELALISCLKDGALGHATTVHPLMRNFDVHGWLIGALRTIQDKRRCRATLPKETRNYAWIAFRPDEDALFELSELVERHGLSLPIGLRVPLGQAGEAFEHIMNRRSGRALILP